MIIFVRNINGTLCELEVEGSTTIDELYCLVWKNFEITSDPVVSARQAGDGLSLMFAGKRLRTRFVDEFALQNGIDVEILKKFYGSPPSNLADYNIQNESRIHLCLVNTEVRRRFERLISR